MILENELKLFLAFSKTNEMYICLHQRVGVHLELLSLHAKWHKSRCIEKIHKMAEEKTLSSPPPCRIPKSQLTAKQPSIKEIGIYKEKIFYIQRQRRNHNQMVGGMHSCDIIKSHTPWGRWPTNWRIIILQKFSHESESSEPHVRLASLKVWHWEEEPPDHLVLKARGSWLQEYHRTGGNRDSTLGGWTQVPVHTGSQRKSSDSIRSGTRSTCWSWRAS